MDLLKKEEKLIGFEKINKLFENIKMNLKRISEIENSLLNQSEDIKINNNKNNYSFDEMEIEINSQLKEYNKASFVMHFFKWMLILFEAISGYLAIGLISHAISFGINEILLQSLIGIFAIAFSYSIVNFAINAIKPKDGNDKSTMNLIISIGAVLALPIFNVSMINFTDLEVNYKEIYTVSLFFTSFTGLLLIFKSREINLNEERRIYRLNDLKNLMLERKSKYQKSRNLHLKIFRENNKYEGVLEKESESLNKSILYTGLKKFIEDCQDFDVWADDFIKNARKADNTR